MSEVVAAIEFNGPGFHDHSKNYSKLHEALNACLPDEWNYRLIWFMDKFWVELEKYDDEEFYERAKKNVIVYDDGTVEVDQDIEWEE